MVGYSSAQILRTILIQSSVNIVVEYRLDVPHYVLVLSTPLETIQVTLANNAV